MKSRKERVLLVCVAAASFPGSIDAHIVLFDVIPRALDEQ